MTYTTRPRLFFILFIAMLISISAKAQNRIDTIRPTLTLRGLDTVILAVHHSYTDPGVDVYDNYSSEQYLRANLLDSTDLDTSKLGIYTFTYYAEDESQNRAWLSRTIQVVDTVAPVISLKGIPTQSICQCCEYNDPGYTVSDNIDSTGNITISKEGTFIDLGSKQDGLYSLRYIATDKSGNIGYSPYRYIYVKRLGEYPCLDDVAGGYCCTSIDEGTDRETNRLTVVPNVTNGITNLIWSNTNSGPAKYQIINETGQPIKVGILIPGQTTILDLTGNAPGTYWIVCQQNGLAAVKKLQLIR